MQCKGETDIAIGGKGMNHFWIKHDKGEWEEGDQMRKASIGRTYGVESPRLLTPLVDTTHAAGGSSITKQLGFTEFFGQDCP